jgi:hypothetical protein
VVGLCVSSDVLCFLAREGSLILGNFVNVYVRVQWGGGGGFWILQIFKFVFSISLDNRILYMNIVFSCSMIFVVNITLSLFSVIQNVR